MQARNPGAPLLAPEIMQPHGGLTVWFLVGNGGNGLWGLLLGIIQGLLQGSIPPFPTKHQTAEHESNEGKSIRTAKLRRASWHRMDFEPTRSSAKRRGVWPCQDFGDFERFEGNMRAKATEPPGTLAACAGCRSSVMLWEHIRS